MVKVHDQEAPLAVALCNLLCYAWDGPKLLHNGEETQDDQKVCHTHPEHSNIRECQEVCSWELHNASLPGMINAPFQLQNSSPLPKKLESMAEALWGPGTSKSVQTSYTAVWQLL